MPSSRRTISLAAALTLIRAYQVEQVFQSLLPLAAPLIAEDDRRRYLIDKDIPIRTPDGATSASVRHVYAAIGNYNVKVTVLDTTGLVTVGTGVVSIAP